MFIKVILALCLSSLLNAVYADPIKLVSKLESTHLKAIGLNDKNTIVYANNNFYGISYDLTPEVEVVPSKSIARRAQFLTMDNRNQLLFIGFPSEGFVLKTYKTQKGIHEVFDSRSTPLFIDTSSWHSGQVYQAEISKQNYKFVLNNTANSLLVFNRQNTLLFQKDLDCDRTDDRYAYFASNVNTNNSVLIRCASDGTTYLYNGKTNSLKLLDKRLSGNAFLNKNSFSLITHKGRLKTFSLKRHNKTIKKNLDARLINPFVSPHALIAQSGIIKAGSKVETNSDPDCILRNSTGFNNMRIFKMNKKGFMLVSLDDESKNPDPYHNRYLFKAKLRANYRTNYCPEVTFEESCQETDETHESDEWGSGSVIHECRVKVTARKPNGKPLLAEGLVSSELMAGEFGGTGNGVAHVFFKYTNRCYNAYKVSFPYNHKNYRAVHHYGPYDHCV